MYSTRLFARRAFRIKVLAAVYDVNGGLKSKRILRAASEKPSGDKLVNALLVAGQIAGVRCRVDGRMCLVIIPAPAGLGESTAILKTGPFRKYKKKPVRILLGSKGTPSRVYDLLGDQRREIELWIILVSLCSWVRKKSLLVETLGNLSIIAIEACPV